MAAWISQLRKGLVEFCILLVVDQESVYGYSLVQRLRNVPNLSFTESTVYPALARLIDEKLIAATRRSSPVGPPRRYLSLTAKGRKRLEEMRRHWEDVCVSVDLLMQLKKGQRHD